MGSSKIIIVSGLCVMLGFYAYIMQKASEAVMYSGTERRARTQATNLSTAAVNLAGYALRRSDAASYNVFNVQISGGIVGWRVTSIDSTQWTATVTATGVFGPDTVTQYAKLTKVFPPWWDPLVRPRWKITSLYNAVPRISEIPYRITR